MSASPGATSALSGVTGEEALGSRREEYPEYEAKRGLWVPKV